ncbi:MAG: CSLREA domain-containing protein [Edaphobacter sp.]
MPASFAPRCGSALSSFVRKFGLCGVVCMLGLMLASASVYAQTTYTVNTTADSNDGSCSPTCSLRDAIIETNGEIGDTIDFSGAGASGTITLTSALPAIAEDVTITGPSANVLTISGLTIANGNSGGNDGGGIFNDTGSLTVSNSTLSGNTATNNAGGIENVGALTLTNSIVAGNTSTPRR